MRTNAKPKGELGMRVDDEAEPGLRELTNQELVGVSGGLTVVEAVRNAAEYLRSIAYPNVSCYDAGLGQTRCVRWGWQ